MRCPNCNKFVGHEAEGEVMDEGVDAESQTATREVRIVLQCSECGEELAETNLEVEFDLSHECTKKGEEREIECDEPEVNIDDRFEGKGRGIKHFYVADCTMTYKCNCGHEGEASATEEEQASSFEQLY